MLEIVQNGIFRGVGALFALTWLFPAGVLFLVYILYIVVKTIQELRKK